MENRQLSRRELLAAGGVTLGSLALGRVATAKEAPAAPVAIARCRSFERAPVEQSLRTLFDQIGGIGPLVKNKTVALKLNLTGQPQRFPTDPALPYRSDPNTVLAVAQLISRAGARRIRILETFFPGGAGYGAVGAVRLRHQRHQQRRLQGGMGKRAEHGAGQAVHRA